MVQGKLGRLWTAHQATAALTATSTESLPARIRAAPTNWFC